eukprot:TRINITY_DN103594_c0_g1_i1.p1 TRINITY_DN103594_c0_g1~~TRINITY_DN103594_c0_g1_i1.p1  ORF type:complete len:588 (-),score=76.55 TRINITY_DN103594_c0_g1_i1:1-1764(-)
MALILAKQVDIKNRRLEHLYYFLMLAMFSANVVRYALTFAWTVTIPVHSHVFLDLRISESRDAIFSSNFSRSEICEDLLGQSMIFNSTKLADASFKPGWSRCRAPCVPLNYDVYSSTDCADILSLAHQRGSSTVDVAVLTKEYLMTSDGLSWVYASASPWLENVVFGVGYDYSLASNPPWFFGTPEVGTKADTILLDKHGRIWKIVKVGEPIVVSFRDVMSQLTHATWSNGADIDAKVSCFNTNYDLTQHLRPPAYDGSVSHHRPTCLLKFEAKVDELAVLDGKWTETSFVNEAQETIKTWSVFEYDLVRINDASVGGTMRFGETNQLLSLLSILLVLMAMPKTGVQLIAMWSLGKLSDAYRRALLERFSIFDDSVHYIVKSITLPHLFGTITPPGTSGITEECLVRAAQAVFAGTSEFEEHEVEALARMSFVSMCRKKGKRAKMPAEDTGNSINLEDFCSWYSLPDRINHDLIAQIFDKDRSKYLLEKFFMPAEIRSALNIDIPQNRPASGAGCEQSQGAQRVDCGTGEMDAELGRQEGLVSTDDRLIALETEFRSLRQGYDRSQARLARLEGEVETQAHLARLRM